MLSESSLKKWISTAKSFMDSAGFKIEDYWTLNFADLESYAYTIAEERGLKGKSLEGFIRNVKDGIPRYYGQYLIESRVPNIMHDDLLKTKEQYIPFLDQFKIQTPPERIYNSTILPLFPSPFNGEKIEGKGQFPHAYCGHYIIVNLTIPEFLDVLDITPTFDFVNLHLLLAHFFNAKSCSETFKHYSRYRIAFRVCFEGLREEIDENTHESVYTGEEFYSFVHFDDSNASLITQLMKINDQRKDKENYRDNFGDDVRIKWILPLFPFEDSEFFSREFNERIGFYCYYKKVENDE